MKSRCLKIFKFNAVIILVLAFTSCVPRQQIQYFQDEIAEGDASVFNNHQMRYKTNDMLTIDVSALDPEVAKPFNLALISTNTDIMDAQGQLKVQTYIIDVEGNIDFPVLGKVKMDGLTRMEATAMLKEKLTEYIKDPIVTIRLANFTIMVLGEVKNPGTYTIEDERVSLTEALGLAGDLTIHGRRDNVFLIRETNGKQSYAKFDLTSIKVLQSPNYYLEQNDVIYVEPNNARRKEASFNQTTTILATVVISTLATLGAALILR